jgi:GDP-4-dehydro-6-deoxy-D-mannose reductase
MTQRALITGASGFVGRKLRDYLIREGWEVVGCGFPAAEGVITCDITRGEDVEAVLDVAGDLTHVFHLAAVTFVPDAKRDPEGAMSVNLFGTMRLLHALGARQCKARFLNIGSSDAYGRPVSLPMTEEHPLNPENPYAISKAATDQYCAYLAKTGEMDIVRVRPFNHTGAGQSDQFVLSSIAHQIAELEADESRPAQLKVGNLDAARDFSHVDDIIRGYALAALQGTPGEVYNICAGRSQQIGVALEKLLRLSSRDIEVVVDPARVRPVDVPEVVGSHERLTTATGWTPEISFDALLEELLTYWRTQVQAGVR